MNNLKQLFIGTDNKNKDRATGYNGSTIQKGLLMFLVITITSTLFWSCSDLNNTPSDIITTNNTMTEKSGEELQNSNLVGVWECIPANDSANNMLRLTFESENKAFLNTFSTTIENHVVDWDDFKDYPGKTYYNAGLENGMQYTIINDTMFYKNKERIDIYGRQFYKDTKQGFLLKISNDTLLLGGFYEEYPEWGIYWYYDLQFIKKK